MILRFKYYERPGFQVLDFRLRYFKKLLLHFTPESNLRLDYSKADFNRIYDLIDSFSS